MKSMEELLNNDFTAYFGIAPTSILDIKLQTKAPYFEIEEDRDKNLQIDTIPNSGTAKYANPKAYEIDIINYEKFVTALPNSIQRNKGRCDAIVFTSNINKYFIFNELKYRKLDNKVRKKAKQQLLDSLSNLSEVATIHNFINSFEIKRCCFFNKTPSSPPILNVIDAFNRLNQLTTDGLQMSNTSIEAFGFDYYEYSKGQILSFK